jgi:hypothetical protein
MRSEIAVNHVCKRGLKNDISIIAYDLVPEMWSYSRVAQWIVLSVNGPLIRGVWRYSKYTKYLFFMNVLQTGWRYPLTFI